jgi:type IV pilus assembly protein PilC
MIFHYTALNENGNREEGDVDATSLDNAIFIVKKKGYPTIIEVKEKIDKNNDVLSAIKKSSLFRQKITNKDVVIFSRQVATLFESGVSALRAFRLLGQENENKSLQEEVFQVADDIEKGISLSQSLAKHPVLFSNFYVNMVKSGEESGKLNEVFAYLADYMDRNYELTQKVKKALTYPGFVIGVFFAIMGAMLTFVVPKMAAMFAEEGATLPLVTRIVLFISDLFVKYGPITFPVMAVAIYLFYRWTKTEDGGFKFDAFLLKTPVVKTLMQKLFLLRLSDNMNTMLSNGVPIVKSIDITASVVENRVYKKLMERVSQKVQMGKSFSKALYEEPLVPNILVQMVHIGEETGELSFILKNLANFYRRELDNAIDSMIALIEPAMIVSLGVGVGFLVSAILLPMYSLTEAIK